MCDRVLSDISSAFSSTIWYAPNWVGDARTKPELRYGWAFLRTISVMPRFCFARHVVRNINILEQNALTMKCLQSFWNARVHPGSAIRNVS